MSPVVETPPPKPAERLYTLADLLAMPDDGVERWLIDGRIVEVGMTIRNKRHTLVQSLVNGELEAWRKTQPRPRGTVHAGEAGVRLRSNPDLIVGIDVVYLAPEISAEVMADDTTTIIDAIPTLAVEILSPSDTVENLRLKIDTYRAVGVSLVWVVDPHYRTVTVHRPARPPVLLNEEQELEGGPELPGFRVPVVRFFED